MRSHYRMSMRRLRGLTVVDTVVLLAVLVFLMGGLLVPALSRARAEATNDTCASHLANIGKAMLVYAADREYALPRAGGMNSNWWPVVWNAPTRQSAYTTTIEPNYYIGAKVRGDPVVVDPNDLVAIGGNCTISSCFYLLVKYTGMDPNQFVCPQDPNTSAFTLDTEDPNSGITELGQAWDFGSKPQTHCSYAYHAPWGYYALTMSDDPNMAVAADRNPWLDSPGFKKKTFPAGQTLTGQTVVFKGKTGNDMDERYGNSSVHNEDGQNVLFLDGRVSFENRAYCGLEDDNIYTVSWIVDKGDALGRVPVQSTIWGASPVNRKDSVLVHDPPAFVAYTATRGS
jgi:hypothetical protein